MTLTNEDLLAISQLLDAKLDARSKPIENELRYITVDLLENTVIPRLDTIETCYNDTYKRYLLSYTRVRNQAPCNTRSFWTT